METHRIIRLGHRGDGVAEAPDGPLYAAFALPGETVTGARDGERLTVARIDAPAPKRIAPVCAHFGACGGCALQHASDALLAEWKTAQIAAALAQQGLEAPIRPIHVSPPGARRRVTLAARRTKKGALVGFHGRADEAIVPIAECAVADPAIVAALPALPELTALCASRAGALRITLTVSQAGLDVAVEGAKPLDGPARLRLAAWAGALDAARLTLDGETVAQARPPAQPMGRARVVPPPGGFLQATRDGEAALVAAVTEAVGGARRVADLFAGCGTFSVPLAEAAEVHAVEAERDALKALDAGWRRAEGLKAITTEARDLFDRPLRPEELARFDAAVFDPPRAGAAAQAAQLAASALRRVAAVSCNPGTFARDARTLVAGGFRLLWAQPVDQFRWSPHVELAAAFARD
jgi:23S rRNA (uracil1939-C5)-methyltransferase